MFPSVLSFDYSQFGQKLQSANSVACFQPHYTDIGVLHAACRVEHLSRQGTRAGVLSSCEQRKGTRELLPGGAAMRLDLDYGGVAAPVRNERAECG